MLPVAFSTPEGQPPPQRDGTHTYFHKPFCVLFSDAATLAFYSRADNKDVPPIMRKRCARSSILSAAFALEAAANCCIGALGLARQPSKEVDRLATLGKFDVFLMSRGTAGSLDRGSAVVQHVSDIIDLRNAAVHPKTQTRKFVVGTEIKRTRLEVKMAPHLRVPLEYQFWSPRDAEKVLRALCDFLNFYLLGLCKLPVPASKAILCTEWHDPKGDIYSTEQEFSLDLLDVASKWKLDLRFLYTWKSKTEYKDGKLISVTYPAYPENEVHYGTEKHRQQDKPGT